MNYQTITMVIVLYFDHFKLMYSKNDCGVHTVKKRCFDDCEY